MYIICRAKVDDLAVSLSGSRLRSLLGGDSNEGAEAKQNHAQPQKTVHPCNRPLLHGGHRARSIPGHRGAEGTRHGEHGQVWRRTQAACDRGVRPDAYLMRQSWSPPHHRDRGVTNRCEAELEPNVSPKRLWNYNGCRSAEPKPTASSQGDLRSPGSACSDNG